MTQPIAETEGEIDQAVTSVVETLMQSMPFDAQSSNDKACAEHMALKKLASAINPRLEKLEKPIKEGYRKGLLAKDYQTKNYFREITEGTPRSLFDKSLFIDLIAAEYPDLMKHKLIEIAEKAVTTAAAPVSIKFELQAER